MKLSHIFSDMPLVFEQQIPIVLQESFDVLDASELEDLLSAVEYEQEEIDNASYADDADDSKLEKDYRALEAVATVIKNNQIALDKPELMQSSIFLYNYQESGARFAVAAVQIWLEKTVAHVKWLGSYGLPPGSGKKLLLAGLEQAKLRGALKTVVDSKWESEGFYHKLGYDVLHRGEFNPFSGSRLVKMGRKLEESPETEQANSLDEKWTKKYKKSINCRNPRGFSQRAHCAARKKRQAGGKTSSKSVSENRMDRLVEGMLSHLTSQGLTETEAVAQIDEHLSENLRKWFQQKWVRFGPDGKIRGACARGSEGEGKPKCLPQKKAWALGKKKRATAARRKRREDPNPEREGRARNVATKESQSCPSCGGEIVDESLINEKRDACYYKVKSRYKVWPSAYASGALVQCRKKGAQNWGKGKK